MGKWANCARDKRSAHQRVGKLPVAAAPCTKVSDVHAPRHYCWPWRLISSAGQVELACMLGHAAAAAAPHGSAAAAVLARMLAQTCMKRPVLRLRSLPSLRARSVGDGQRSSPCRSGVVCFKARAADSGVCEVLPKVHDRLSAGRLQPPGRSDTHLHSSYWCWRRTSCSEAQCRAPSAFPLLLPDAEGLPTRC